MRVRKAVIPAAGFGTRFIPYTKAIPKEMICVVDKPAIQLIVEEAVKSGIEEILIITSRHKNMIENHFDRVPELEQFLADKGKDQEWQMVNDISKMARIYYVRQQEMLGLGHAIGLAQAFVGNEPFAILLGDDVVVNDTPCLKQLIDAFDAYQCSVVGVQTVQPSQVSKYGIIDGEHLATRTYSVKGMIEKPRPEEAPTNVAILGRYILTPKIFEKLKATQPGKNNEIQLTDAMIDLLEDEKMVAYDFEGKRYDTGDKLGYMKACTEFALGHEEIKEEYKAYLKRLVESL